MVGQSNLMHWRSSGSCVAGSATAAATKKKREIKEERIIEEVMNKIEAEDECE